jgi:exodeoxyribonuclease V alpha subunit
MVGRVSILQEARELTVSFDGREVDRDFAGLDELVPAYAVSVHKEQRSLYPVVVIAVRTQHYVLL